MEYLLTIPGRLPGLNEYISAERANRYKGAKLKSGSECMISDEITAQLKGIQIKKPVEMHYLWIEPNNRRDRGNIAFAKNLSRMRLWVREFLKMTITGMLSDFPTGLRWIRKIHGLKF